MSPAEKRLRRRLAASLRSLREQRRLTLEEAAALTGIHWRHWQKIEAGEVNTTLRTLARIGDGLDTPPADLLK